MFRIDGSTAAPALPAPSAVSGTPGYFTGGDPAAMIPATDVSADWLNMIQEELLAIVVAGGLQPDKTKRDQVVSAIRTIIASGGVSFATLLEAVAGTITTKAMSPASSAALVADRIAAVIGGAPDTLNTLGELAQAIGNDPNHATNVSTALAARALTARQILGGGLATGGGTLDADQTITVTAATGPEIIAGAAGDKVLTPAGYAAAGGGDGSSGWAPLPGGNMIQWGSITIFGGSNTIEFTIPFVRPFLNVCGSVVANAEPAAANWQPLVVMLRAPTIAGVSGKADTTEEKYKVSGARVIRWQAIGR